MPAETLTCEACGRKVPIAYQGPEPSVSELVTKTLGSLGWAKTQTGWLCPGCSDKGPTDLLRLALATKKKE